MPRTGAAARAVLREVARYSVEHHAAALVLGISARRRARRVAWRSRSLDARRPSTIATAANLPSGLRAGASGRAARVAPRASVGPGAARELAEQQRLAPPTADRPGAARELAEQRGRAEALSRTPTCSSEPSSRSRESAVLAAAQVVFVADAQADPHDRAVDELGDLRRVERHLQDRRGGANVITAEAGSAGDAENWFANAANDPPPGTRVPC
jgi:hypothetical protein